MEETNTLKLARQVKPSFKGALRNEFQMSEREFSKYINPIISENRGITEKAAKFYSKLRPIEIVKFYEKIGEPLRESCFE